MPVERAECGARRAREASVIDKQRGARPVGEASAEPGRNGEGSRADLYDSTWWDAVPVRRGDQQTRRGALGPVDEDQAIVVVERHHPLRPLGLAAHELAN